jgi:hypothetical protein
MPGGGRTKQGRGKGISGQPAPSIAASAATASKAATGTASPALSYDSTPPGSAAGPPSSKMRRTGGDSDDMEDDGGDFAEPTPAPLPPAGVDFEALFARHLAPLVQKLADTNNQTAALGDVLRAAQVDNSARFVAVHRIIEDQNARIAAFTAGRDPWAVDHRTGSIDIGIQARLDAIESSLQVLKVDQASAPAPSVATASGSGPRGPAPSTTTRSPTSSAATVWYKVFFDGCACDLHRAVLGRYWNDTVKPLLPDAATAGTRPFIGNRDSFSVGFLTQAAAQDFIANLVVKGGAPVLVHDGRSHTMAAHLERSKVPTKYGKRLSPIYQHYVAKLSSREGWLTDFKLVADAHRGRVYLEKGERIILIHSLVPGGDSLRTFSDDLAEFGLDLADCLAAAALFAVA